MFGIRFAQPLICLCFNSLFMVRATRSIAFLYVYTVVVVKAVQNSSLMWCPNIAVFRS